MSDRQIDRQTDGFSALCTSRMGGRPAEVNM